MAIGCKTCGRICADARGLAIHNIVEHGGAAPQKGSKRHRLNARQRAIIKALGRGRFSASYIAERAKCSASAVYYWLDAGLQTERAGGTRWSRADADRLIVPARAAARNGKIA